MFVGQPALVEFGLELACEDLGEDILEAAVIDFEDGVLGGEVDRHVPGKRVVEGGTGEVADRIVEVEHGKRDAPAFELVNLMLDLCSVLPDEADSELALAQYAEVRRPVDIAK